MTEAPLILWFRRDLRLDDHPMLSAACATGRPLIPVFIADDSVTGLGAAPRWRMGEAVDSFAQRLRTRGSRLILRRGPALVELLDLLRATGATGVWWTRLYDPLTRDRDSLIKETLKSQGVAVQSFHGHTLAEPWQVQTGAGSYFKVFTPFWNALKTKDVPAPTPAPMRLAPPQEWPRSDTIDQWHLGSAMNRGASVVARHAQVGEDRAHARLDRFIAQAIDTYSEHRDFPAMAATSGLSENLTCGEIGPRRIWHSATETPGGLAFRRELAWRDFAHHLMFHTPQMLTDNWRPQWDGFPWHAADDATERWRRGLTGEPLVDAGMRQMWVTGTMHNRVRMIVASYLTKHLMTHWKTGMDWFSECLIDWDPAANAMGWQWVAGSGPDAAPFFRVFNPAGQAEKFDKSGDYRRKFIAELSRNPGPEASSWFDAAPLSWRLDPAAPYPAPVMDLATGRARALAAYAAHRAGDAA